MKETSNLVPNRNNLFGWSALVLTIVISVMWMGNTPLHSDDYYYRKMPGPDKATALGNYEGVFITEIGQIPTAIHNHWLESNGRWANLAYLSVQLFPLRLIKYLCGALMGVFALLLWFWAGRRSLDNALVSMVIPIMMWMGFPWNVNMQSADFQFNYNIPAVLLMGSLILFFNPRKKLNAWAWVLLFVFGAWHECFTIAFGFFIAIQWLYTRRRVYFYALLVLIVGFLVQFGPGSQTRTGIYNSFTSLSAISLTQIVFQGWISWVGFVWWLVRRNNIGPTRRRALDRFAFGLMAAWFAFILMKIFVAAPERAEWGVDTLAIAFVLLIMRTYRPLAIPEWVKVGLIFIYALWGTSLVAREIRVRRFSEYCYRQMENGIMTIRDKEGVADEPLPFWLMEIPKPQYGSFRAYDHNDIAFCATEREWATYMVLPDSLYGKPFKAFPKVPGDNDLRFATSNLFVRKKDGLDLKNTYPRVYFGDATIETSPLDRLLGLIRGKETAQSTRIHVLFQYDMVYEGDTLQTIMFEPLPRTYRGRHVTRIDF